MAIPTTSPGTRRTVPEEIKKEHVLYKGKLQKQLSMWQAVALIVATTIGAGIVGIPYVVAQVGVPIGILYIVGFGLLMMHMNLMIGEIAVRTKEDLQLVGLAERYLGKGGKWVMMGLVYLTVIGALTVYIIGMGEGLAALLPGSELLWSIVFFLFGAVLVFTGMKAVKAIEIFLVSSVLAVVVLISAVGFSEIYATNLVSFNFLNIFIPYGVILFALHSSTSIPEAHTLLAKRENQFKRAISIASVISICVYVIFAVVVVGTTGAETTPIATIGIGEKLGPVMGLLGNLFALLAIGTSFLILGLSFRDSLQWDFKFSVKKASVLACAIPFAIFLFGLRGFIEAIGIVGGIFISLELILMLVVYWRIEHYHIKEPTSVIAKHSHILIGVLFLLLLIGLVHSVYSAF